MKLINWADTTVLAQAETYVLVDGRQDAISLGLSNDFIRLLEKELERRGVIRDKGRTEGKTGELQWTSMNGVMDIRIVF